MRAHEIPIVRETLRPHSASDGDGAGRILRSLVAARADPIEGQDAARRAVRHGQRQAVRGSKMLAQGNYLHGPMELASPRPPYFGRRTAEEPYCSRTRALTIRVAGRAQRWTVEMS